MKRSQNMHNNEEPPEGLGLSDGSTSFHGGPQDLALPRRARPNQLAFISGEINSRIMNSPWFSGAEKFAHRLS